MPDRDESTDQDEFDVVDPDIDRHDRGHVGAARPRQWDIVAAVAGGGIVGAEARYGVGLVVPHAPHEFPWSTVLINASGCLVIGALMVLLLELTSPHRLARPFLGVGILGGYTTFSTFAVDAVRLAVHHRPLTAFGYVATTLTVCAVAVWISTIATMFAGRAVIGSRTRRELPRSAR